MTDYEEYPPVLSKSVIEIIDDSTDNEDTASETSSINSGTVYQTEDVCFLMDWKIIQYKIEQLDGKKLYNHQKIHSLITDKSWPLIKQNFIESEYSSYYDLMIDTNNIIYLSPLPASSSSQPEYA